LRAGVSALFVGLTVVGFGTSSPEITASLAATLRGSSDVTVGNVVGSNTLNVGVILGLTTWIRPMRVKLRAVRRDLMVAIAAAAVPLVTLLTAGQIRRSLGLVLLTALGLYVWFAFRTAPRAERGEKWLAQEEVTSTLSIDPAGARLVDRSWFNIGLVMLGLVMMCSALAPSSARRWASPKRWAYPIS
jgi:cation:H+ antiporter